MANLREQADMVHVKASRPNPPRRCTAQQPSGEFCDAPSLPDAPYPICQKHAAKVLTFLRGRMQDLDDELVLEAEHGGVASALHAPPRLGRAAKAHAELTYYLQVDAVIKIGHTKNLPQRKFQYPPYAKVLAVEWGNREMERHRQFAHLLKHGREWFEPGRDLLAHIDTLRSEAGRQPVSRIQAAL